jgi:hypothetical protein
MNNSDFEINGVPVWEAECEIDEDKLPEDYVLNMAYLRKKYFLWSYSEIQNALDTGVDMFVKQMLPNDAVSPVDVKELETFFIYWTKLVNNELLLDGEEE